MVPVRKGLENYKELIESIGSIEIKSRVFVSMVISPPPQNQETESRPPTKNESWDDRSFY